MSTVVERAKRRWEAEREQRDRRDWDQLITDIRRRELPATNCTLEGGLR